MPVFVTHPPRGLQRCIPADEIKTIQGPDVTGVEFACLLAYIIGVLVVGVIFFKFIVWTIKKIK